MSLLVNFLHASKLKLIRVEKLVAGISLLLLLILALLQVILRNLFEIGFSEIEVVARHLVLFITFMGAALASEGSRHIKIDCMNRFLSFSVKEKLALPLLLISSTICAIFFWYALQFWLDERLYAPVNEQLALYLALIIPIGFFTLSLHLLLLCFTLNAVDQRQ